MSRKRAKKWYPRFLGAFYVLLTSALLAALYVQRPRVLARFDSWWDAFLVYWPGVFLLLALVVWLSSFEGRR
jgi:hypothetical protein